MAEVDLDQLADAYHLRPMSGAAFERATTSASGCGGWMLDIGGGPGGHAATWVSSPEPDTSRRPVVVDPSSAMLDQARAHAGVEVVRARSHSLPFAENSAGLAYFHLSIHYGDWRKAMDEAFRVTHPGGRVEIWTMSHEAIRNSSLVRWFPAVEAIDLARLPVVSDLADYCRELGSGTDVSAHAESIERTSGSWTNAVENRFVSTLQLLTDEEIAGGIRRFRDIYPDPEMPYHYELGLTRISSTV